jgi:hypothetical protein
MLDNFMNALTRFCGVPALLTSFLMICSCGGDAGNALRDDTEAVQNAVNLGGVIKFEARTYRLSRTIVIKEAGTVIQGTGPGTVFRYHSSAIREHCANERVFTTPCEINDAPPRRIADPIALGDRSFSAVGDVSDLQPGDWLIVSDRDSEIGDVVTIDWVQVDSVSALVVHVRTPFRTSFTTARHWDPGRSGLGFQRVTTLVQNTEFRDFTIDVPDAGPNTAAVGISVFAALHTTIDHVNVDSFNAQPLYSYLSKDLTIRNSVGRGHGVLSEFAATVDLVIHSNQFAEDGAAGMGLDLGAAFFDVSNNDIDMSRNIGAYLLYGVHDGIFGGNRIANVTSAGDASGILAWGTHDVSIVDNYLAGGDGPQSTGISVRSIGGTVQIPSFAVKLSGNTFGSKWFQDYEPGTVPSN